MIACDSAIWNGNIYDSSGIYVGTLQTLAGCDSVITMDLTIHYSIDSSDSVVSCNFYEWNGNVYFTTGTYYDTLQTIGGCDSGNP